MPKRRGSVNPLGVGPVGPGTPPHIGVGPVGPGTPPPIHIPGIDLTNGTTFLFFQNKVKYMFRMIRRIREG